MHSLFIDQNILLPLWFFVLFYSYKRLLLVTAHLRKKLVWHERQKELLTYIDRPIKKCKFQVGGYGTNFTSWGFCIK